MSFSIKSIKEILSKNGLPEESIEKVAEEICSKHSADLQSIKDERERYKEDSEKLANVNNELSDLKEKYRTAIEYKAKYEEEQTNFANYKSSIEQKEIRELKQSIVKAYFEEKGIRGQNLEIAMRGFTDKDFEGVEVEENKLKDTTNIDSLINGCYSVLVDEKQSGSTTIYRPQKTTTQEAENVSRASVLASMYQKNLYGEKKEN